MSQAEETPKKPLTKQERQLQERNEKLNREASLLHERLCNEFVDFFALSSDPEGQEVKNKQIVISSRWKVFCHAKGLNQASYGFIDKFCNDILEAYMKVKEDQLPKGVIYEPSLSEKEEFKKEAVSRETRVKALGEKLNSIPETMIE